ncbi:hypothetical protein BpHYR1_032697 [Brachionus plicatilis]|uniref:Uncharacterized protein n=1 Tax=Brachionus plicatilis TaxID=10195 RepID=A0A3M7Q4Q8_BRAPC|nr:hypothetical protein BpHYR1_032697 [Brachionus plicatilis]
MYDFFKELKKNWNKNQKVRDRNESMLICFVLIVVIRVVLERNFSCRVWSNSQSYKRLNDEFGQIDKMNMFPTKKVTSLDFCLLIYRPQK